MQQQGTKLKKGIETFNNLTPSSISLSLSLSLLSSLYICLFISMCGSSTVHRGLNFPKAKSGIHRQKNEQLRFRKSEFHELNRSSDENWYWPCPESAAKYMYHECGKPSITMPYDNYVARYRVREKVLFVHCYVIFLWNQVAKLDKRCNLA